MTTLCTFCGDEVTDSAHLCERCTGRLERDLGDVGALSEELVTTRLRQSKTGRGGVGVQVKGHARPLPWDQHAAEVADALHATLVGWARVVIEERGFTSPADTDEALSRFLLRHLDWLTHHTESGQPVVGVMLDEVSDAVGRARAAIDLGTERTWAGQCREQLLPDEEQGERCCAAELHLPADRDAGRCRECGSVHELVARKLWLLDVADALLLDATALAAALSLPGRAVTRDVIHGLERRGRIFAEGQDREGRTLFKVGEVRRVLNERTRRTA